MDVDKLFKLPKLPQSSIAKRKWTEPDASALKAARVDDLHDDDNDDDVGSSAGPSRLPSAAVKRSANVRDVEEEDDDVDDADFAPGNDADYFVDEDDEGGRFFGGGLTKQQKRILELMNTSNDPQHGGGGVDDDSHASSPEQELRSLRKSLLQLERAINKNQEMRVKYSGDPQRFIESEADLHSAIRALVVVTTNPALLYPELIKQGTTASLCGLLAHENVDIAASVIELLEEMTDDDVLDAGLEGRSEQERQQEELGTGPRKGQVAVDMVLQSLLDNALVDLLVQTLPRLAREPSTSSEQVDSAIARANAESDAAATFHVLSLLENLVSLRAKLADDLFQSPVLAWLLQHISAKSNFDQIKGYAGELLCIILQSGTSDDVHRRAIAFGGAGGIDQLLEALSSLRKRIPNDDEEREFVENLFDGLCVALTATANKAVFHDSEGTELMCLLMKLKGFVRMRALKVLNHATSGPAGTANCMRFVQSQGLRMLFSAFGSEHASAQDEDNILEITASLLNNLASESIERMRLVSKFVEREYEKVDRLVEVHASAQERLRVVDRTLVDEDEGDDDDDDERQTDRYIRRLDGGLFTLQLADYVLSWLIMEDDGIQAHVKLLFDRREMSLDEVVDTLKAYHGNVGDEVIVAQAEKDDEEPLRLTDVLVQLVNYLLAVI